VQSPRRKQFMFSVFLPLSVSVLLWLNVSRFCPIAKLHCPVLSML
jgi:hypothetical protein